MKVSLLRALVNGIKIHVQCDEHEIRRTKEGILYVFPVLGSDPEHVWEDFGIFQENGMNVINLDKLAEKMAGDESLQGMLIADNGYKSLVRKD